MILLEQNNPPQLQFIQRLMSADMLYKQGHILNTVGYFGAVNLKLFLIQITTSDKFQVAVNSNYLNTLLSSIKEVDFSRFIIRNIVNFVYEAISIIVDSY